MFDIDLWREIFQSIKMNKTRSILSGFTVAFAISLFAILFGITNGLINTFEESFKDDAINNIVIWPGKTTKAYKGLQAGRRIQLKNKDHDYILDEFGDLSYPAFLEVKALWNSTEYRCGWYMMGADGLQIKLERQKALKKVGYAEIFSRLGSRYQRITPVNEKERKQFLLHEITKIIKANKSRFTPLQMYAKTLGSLRRVYIEIVKEKANIAQKVA